MKIPYRIRGKSRGRAKNRRERKDRRQNDPEPVTTSHLFKSAEDFDPASGHRKKVTPAWNGGGLTGTLPEVSVRKGRGQNSGGKFKR